MGESLLPPPVNHAEVSVCLTLQPLCRFSKDSADVGGFDLTLFPLFRCLAFCLALFRKEKKKGEEAYPPVCERVSSIEISDTFALGWKNVSK